MMLATRLWLLFLLALLPLAGGAAPTAMDDILKEVRSFTAADSALDQQRAQEFNQAKANQQALLQQSRVRLAAAEQEQQRLKDLFNANDVALGELEDQISQQSGQLGEVFGVAKEKASELRALLPDSLTSADNPNRTAQLNFADSKRIPTLNDLEALWYQFQLELIAAGNITEFTAPVASINGDTSEQSVVRFGMFAAATKSGEFLQWDPQQSLLVSLPTQPDDGQGVLADFYSGKSDLMLVDPSRGQLFALLDRVPTLAERIQQGAEVGYVIIALGLLGLIVAGWRSLVMLLTETKIRAQLRNESDFSDANALGRVLNAASDHSLTPEQRELKVDEAILKELPDLEKGISFVKLLAAVAPLLGLLGTVVGMIATFQSITQFGTSDPKLMAGGISQALITTVLGLVVAIPLLFSHSYLTSRSRRLVQILQQKSLGLLAGTS